MMNIKRFTTYLRIALFGHVLNWVWRPGNIRRCCRGEVTRKAVLDYLRQYAPYISDIPEDAPSEPEPERIFSIWLQGEDQAPAIVRACWRSIRRCCSQELVILDDKTLPQWIELPDYIMRKWKEGRMRPAHFTDICRTELLLRHGGVWMDATDFATASIPDYVMNEDFFIFRSDGRLSGSYAFVQNCFFRARKGSYLLKVWNEAIQTYWKYEDSTMDYYVHQMLFGLAVSCNPRARALFERMPALSQDATHALWWDYRDRPFSREVFDRVTSGTFFQKTEYKSRSASSPLPGSFSDVMQRM